MIEAIVVSAYEMEIFKMENYTIKPIAHIHTDFPAKFGLPRQSGAVPELEGEIVFENEYRERKAVEGLEEYSRIWVIWQFSENARDSWSPTVRPPVLGGNKRVGVFATRSSFRPNALGLSNLALKSIEYTKDRGPVLRVSGIDMMDGTPVFDIKPYIPAWDSHPKERAGFTGTAEKRLLEVHCSDELLAVLPEEKRQPLLCALAQDPRPSYQNDPNRIYGFSYAGVEVRFLVENNALTVVELAH